MAGTSATEIPITKQSLRKWIIWISLYEASQRRKPRRIVGQFACVPHTQLLTGLKVELQPELNHARVARRRDRAEGRVPYHSVRVPERRRVRQIENLRAEFEVNDFAEIRPLDEGDVGRAVTGAAHRVARGVPDRKLRRYREGRRVEPAAGRPLIRRQIRIAKDVRPLRAEPREGVEVRDLCDGECQPRLQQDRAVDAPASEQFVCDPRKVEPPPLSDWQFVGEARDEDVRNVAG